MSAIRRVDHVTLRCTPTHLGPLQAFYQDVIELRSGPRPAFDFPGAWMYADGEPIVHLAAVLGEPMALPTSADEPAAAASPAPAAPPIVQASARPSATPTTGYVDHFALRVDAAVDAVRARLLGLGVSFSEAPVPGFPLHQIFLVDPLGVKIELNFALAKSINEGNNEGLR